MVLQEFTTLDDISNLRGPWTSLWTEVGRTPYQSWEWSYCWWKYLGTAGCYKILTWTDGGEIVCLFPVRLKRYGSEVSCEFIGSRGTDYLDCLARPGCIDECLLDLFAWARRQKADVVHFEDVPSNSPLTYTLVESLNAGRLKGYTEDASPICSVSLPKSWQDFVAGLSNRKAKEIFYDRRYLNRHLLDVGYVKGNLRNLEAHVQLYQLRRAQKGDRGTFRPRSVRCFLEDVIGRFESRGLLRIVFLEAEGRSIASILALTKGSSNFLLTIGFDPAYSRFSPGSVLIGMDIEDCLSQGFQTYDFTRGDEPYKLAWGASRFFNLRIVVELRDGTAEQFREIHGELTKNLDYAPREEREDHCKSR